MRSRLLSFSITSRRALAEARRSVALAPNFAQGHHTIARMLTFSGDAAGAINTLDAYMQLDPIYPDLTLYFLAEARVALGQFDPAVAALKQHTRVTPIQRRHVLCLRRATVTLAGLTKAGRPGRRC